MSLAPALAIVVDVDGTLYRVRRLRVAWRLRFVRGLLLAMVAAREKLRHEGPFADAAALWQREAELVAPSFELTVDEAARQLAELRDALPEALTRGMAPHPGVAAALEAAAARGLKLAVCSDFEPKAKLRYLGLDHLPWQAIHSAEDAGALKPHRACFDRVQAALGVPAKDIIYVGDREDVDVAGALAAGLRAWRFSPKGRAVTQAEHHFSRWTLDLFAQVAPGSSYQ